MSIHWVDSNCESPFSQHTLSHLVHSYVDLKDPSPATNEILRLARLLILSNHTDKAQELLSSVYNLTDGLNDRHTVQPALDVFWEMHQSLLRPKNAPPPGSFVRNLSRQQWDKYRECTRTGWMLEHHRTAEPQDPSIWRDTDDPVMLAMCARLLAKTLTQETYPSPQKMREALAAAQKLYAQPEIPITEWLLQLKSLPAPKRHLSAKRRQSSLLYRRLVVELALRLGEFQTAVDIMSQGLRVDGFVEGANLDGYLILPGIYDVLPLLAEGAAASSPFFINGHDAEVIVREIIKALELRATHGRQWALAEDKVGWKELLDRLAAGAWEVHSKEYKTMGVMSADDILYPPATKEEIEAAEEEFGELPVDFKEMVRIANGFKGGHHLFGGGIAGLQDIAFDTGEGMDDLMPYLEEQVMSEDSTPGGIIQLQPGSECDSFSHYIVPAAVWKTYVAGREVGDGEYRYFHFAPWAGESSTWDTVRHYVASCIEEVEGMIARGEVADGFDESDED